MVKINSIRFFKVLVCLVIIATFIGCNGSSGSSENTPAAENEADTKETQQVDAIKDLWLAGMPDGTSASLGYDVAPGSSPEQVNGLTLSAGQKLTFASTGKAKQDPDREYYGPDGNPDWYTNHEFQDFFTTGPENGISDIHAPFMSLIGVFLDDNQPSDYSAPDALSYDPTDKTFAPGLRQVFFIGDGLTGTGSGTVQTFIVPSGATRLFLGIMDSYGWYNNDGGFDVTVTSSAVQ